MPDRLRRKHNVMLTIVKGIVDNDRLRRLAPFDVEMLEDELKRYREIEAIVAREMEHG